MGDFLRTLQSDNGDVHENVAEKQSPHPFKSSISQISQVTLLVKRREFRLELRRGDLARVQTRIVVEFNALPFPLSSKLKL